MSMAAQVDDTVKMNMFTLRFPEGLEEEFLDDYYHRSIKQLRLAMILGIFLWCGIAFLDVLIAPDAKSKLWFIRFIIYLPYILFLLIITFLPRFKNFIQIGLSLGLFLGGLCVMAMIVIAPEPGNYLYYAGIIIFLMFSSFVKLRFVYTVITAILVVAAYEFAAFRLIDTPLVVLISNTFFLLCAFVISLFTNYMLELYARRNYLQQRLIEIERERSERLLLNILPPSIANRLKMEHRTIADGFSEVTVLFADIVGFTQLAAERTPKEVVDILNEVFTGFDRLAEKHGVEKIKTIGDAYMAVAGLPEKNDRHAHAIADLALDMLAFVSGFRENNKIAVNLRVGINSGPVVAGVIGTRKFIYDVWGDTVNTASRMESHGQAGSIQVTEETYHRLKQDYACEPRGCVTVKGKGNMWTYFLNSRMLTGMPLEGRA